MSFTVLDMVTLLAPPGQVGVRVGTVQGDINGVITINSAFDPTVPPPAFKASGKAVILGPNGGQLFLNVSFAGTFFQPGINGVSGFFTGIYTVTGGSGNLFTRFPANTVFKGNGVAAQPQQPGVPLRPPGCPANPMALGAAFSTFSDGSRGGGGGNKDDK